MSSQEQNPKQNKTRWYQFGKKSKAAPAENDAEQGSKPTTPDDTHELSKESSANSPEPGPASESRKDSPERGPASESRINSPERGPASGSRIESPGPASGSRKIETGLEASRTGLLAKISQVFQGTFDLDDELFDDLEETLMTCDIGVHASLALVDRLRERVEREKIPDQKGVILGLQREIAELLKHAEQPWQLSHTPSVVLVVGVNGVGKTTTTAKIANRLKQQGKSVLLAAADTFRAAAVEQLQEWGQRLDIPVIAQGAGADAAAVAHDALMAAQARQVDVLLIDTAGRLHTQTDLMEQLQKVLRVLRKISPDAPHEVIQVLDAGTGQNALSQLEHFQKAVDVTALALTKLDGSAKGGVALSLTEKFKLPIQYVGVGEGVDDLRDFNAAEFAVGLINLDSAPSR